MSSDDGDLENQAELEEKTRLINQVLELQHTLEDLSARVDAVKEENLKLKSENQVLGQYIENLMSASSVFQTTDTKSKRKKMSLKTQTKDLELDHRVLKWGGGESSVSSVTPSKCLKRFSQLKVRPTSKNSKHV
ncbi:short coiled-coil protein B-like isoform X2 [Trachinotus anak]